MKVCVTVSLEVDAEAWADEYGVSRKAVREDVKRWAADRLNRYDDQLALVTAVR